MQGTKQLIRSCGNRGATASLHKVRGACGAIGDGKLKMQELQAVSERLPCSGKRKKGRRNVLTRLIKI